MVRWIVSVRDFTNSAFAFTHQQSRIILGLDVTPIILAGSDELVATDALVLVLLLGHHGCKAKATSNASDGERKRCEEYLLKSADKSIKNLERRFAARSRLGAPPREDYEGARNL